MSKNVAIILSGCGSFDGAEIGESVCSMLAIEKHGMTFQVFSLDEEQASVVNALTGKKVAQTRNMMEESARFTHGKIDEVDSINVDEFDVLWIPGGFGIVSSFSDLQDKGENGSVHPKIASLIQAFYNQKKPIVSICIAPSIVAKVLHDKKLSITLGQSDTYYDILEKAHHKPERRTAEQFVFDEKSLVYSSPAFMDANASYLKIFTACDNIAAHLTN